jgi:hypothetical protein
LRNWRQKKKKREDDRKNADIVAKALIEIAKQKEQETALRLQEEKRLKLAADRTKLENERVERERARRELERVQRERERTERERTERERTESVRIERERVQRERVERERTESVRIERERVQRERVERERVEPVHHDIVHELEDTQTDQTRGLKLIEDRRKASLLIYKATRGTPQEQQQQLQAKFYRVDQEVRSRVNEHCRCDPATSAATRILETTYFKNIGKYHTDRTARKEIVSRLELEIDDGIENEPAKRVQLTNAIAQRQLSCTTATAAIPPMRESMPNDECVETMEFINKALDGALNAQKWRLCHDRNNRSGGSDDGQQFQIEHFLLPIAVQKQLASFCTTHNLYEDLFEKPNYLVHYHDPQSAPKIPGRCEITKEQVEHMNKIKNVFFAYLFDHFWTKVYPSHEIKPRMTCNGSKNDTPLALYDPIVSDAFVLEGKGNTLMYVTWKYMRYLEGMCLFNAEIASESICNQGNTYCPICISGAYKNDDAEPKVLDPDCMMGRMVKLNCNCQIKMFHLRCLIGVFTEQVDARQSWGGSDYTKFLKCPLCNFEFCDDENPNDETYNYYLDVGKFPPYGQVKLTIERPEDTTARLAFRRESQEPNEFLAAPPEVSQAQLVLAAAPPLALVLGTDVAEERVLAAPTAADVEAAALGEELIFPNM